MYSGNYWGGSFEIHVDPVGDDERSCNMDLDRAALSRQKLDETQRSWLLGPQDSNKKKDKYVDLGCVVCKRKVLGQIMWASLIAFVVIGIPIIIAKSIPKHREKELPPDRYTMALHKALLFFNAQKCKILTLRSSSSCFATCMDLWFMILIFDHPRIGQMIDGSASNY